MAEVHKDLQLTSSVLSFLRAGFYGQIVFHTVLSQLGSTLADESYLQNAHKAMDRVDPWIADLHKGLPIFATAWKTPETFEAIKALEFLKELKAELKLIVPKLESSLVLEDLSSEKEAINLLVASIARTANVRAAFLDSLFAFYTHHNFKELADQVKFQFDDAQEYVQVSHIIFETFKDTGKPDRELLERLRQEAQLAPSDFRAHIHDINILINCYAGEFTFELAEFLPVESDLWHDAQIAPRAAGYWRAYHFSPNDALEWFGVEVQTPSLAANWRRAGFTTQDAPAWAKAGLPPALARVWLKAGFEPEHAGKMIARGIIDPMQAQTGEANKAEQQEEDSWEAKQA